jgi:diguanylate cyclase (GGDEF)-like protein
MGRTRAGAGAGARSALAVVVLALAALLAPAVGAADEITVRLQLKWTHQFQFAGVYAALAQGYYRSEGLDLRIIEGGPSVDPVAVVTGREAEFGIGNSSLVVDRAHGAPITVVAPIFQHSPFVILARTEAGLDIPRDLAGRTLALETHSAEVEAYLKQSGVPLDSIRVVPHTGDAVGLFASGIDAMSAYTTSEPYDLLVAGVPFQMWSPREIGIDFYGDTLFVDSRFAADNPEVVRAVRDATLAGWRYALAHTGEVIDLINRRYAPGLDRQRLEFEANDTRRLIIPDIVDVGYGSGARWRHIADVFAAAGMMPENAPLDGFVFEEPPPATPIWPYVALAAAVMLLVVVALVAHRFYRISRALREEMEARRRLEGELRELARTDELTRLPNRRHFLESATAIVEAAARDGAAAAVVLFDIDDFKAVNDGFGHAEGDRVLAAVAQACRARAPPDAVFARIGGEEFALVLRGEGRAFAVMAAEQLRAAVAGVRVPAVDGATSVTVTASFGLAFAGRGDGIDALLSRADHAMYAAKRAGGDRVVAPDGGSDPTAPSARGSEASC